VRLNRLRRPRLFERRASYPLFATCFLCLQFFLVGCSGGGSASTPPPTPPPPSEDFSLTVPPSATLQQGGAPQRIYVDAILSGEVVSNLTISFPNLPQGVSVWPNPPTVLGPNLGMNQNYFLFATSAAAPGKFTVNVSGTLGSVIHSYPIPVTITAAAPFQLSLSPKQLSLTPGVPQNVQASVVSNSGPIPDVSLSTLFASLELSSPIVTGAEPGPFTLTFTSTLAAQPLSNFPIFVTATSNAGDTYTVELPVSLTVPFPRITAPTRSTVVRTDDIPTGVVYDAARKLVFAALPRLNEVRVFSSVDAHLVATIPTIHPSSIDEAADGSKVFAGSFGLVTTIDPDSLQVVQSNSIPTPPGSVTTLPVQLVTLSSGNVMVLSVGTQATSQTVTQLYLWNPATSVATALDPQVSAVESLSRSADRTKVLVQGSFGDVFYDAPSGTFGSLLSGTPTPTYGLPGSGTVLNPNGSQVAFITAGFLDICDEQLNVLASEPLNSGQLIYSLDGKTLYAFFWQEDAGDIGVAYDTTTLAPKGLFSMYDQVDGPTPAIPYAIDETGMIFGPAGGDTSDTIAALAFTDASHPGALIPDQSLQAQTFLAGSSCPLTSTTIGGSQFPPTPILYFPNVLCAPPSTLLSGQGFDSSVQYGLFVGPPPASPAAESASRVSVGSFFELDFSLPATPPNNTPGPVNLTLTRPDGWYQVIPEGFSYGPSALFADPTGIPPSGNTTIDIVGYFLDSSTVTIAGKPAPVVGLYSGAYARNTGGIFPLEQLQVTAPAGTPGPADITITTSTGSTTLSNIQYLNSAQVVPIAGTLSSIFYDQPRQRLYISNTDHNRVEVLNLSTQALLSPISVGNAPTNLSLTPDGTRLAVLNSTDGTISVIDPVQMKVINTYAGYTLQDQTNCPDPTPSGWSAVTIEPHRELIAFACPYVVHVLNLDTGVISCTGITGCDSTGTILNAGFASAGLPAVVYGLASSADGTKAFMVSGSSSQVSLLNLAQNTLTTSPGVPTQGPNAAIDGDDNLAAGNLAIYNSQVVPVNLASGVAYFDTTLEGELGGGEAFNPSGSLLFLPNYPVYVFDVHQGRLALRIGLPEQPTVPKTPSLAVDETGTKFFVITHSGVTIAQIAVVPLSIASVNPASGASGTTVTIRGSGFQSGASVLFGTSSATTTFVDGMTLTAIVPNLSSGPVRVTVTNPGGQQYFFDAAYTVN
jgi:hypothetical protein